MIGVSLSSYLFAPSLLQNTQKGSAAILLVNFTQGRLCITMVKTSNVFQMSSFMMQKFISSSYKVCCFFKTIVFLKLCSLYRPLLVKTPACK